MGNAHERHDTVRNAASGRAQRRRGRRRAITLALAVSVPAFAALTPAVASAANVKIVGPGHYPTIQAAVNASAPGGWVLIEPGTYHEAVRVTTPGLHIRGMNRNTVVIDGQHSVGNGIEVHQANDVWIENLTVRNFEFGGGCEDEECGNEIWWNGGSGSGRVGAHGWWGSYLTAYDTGMQGGYGIFTGNESEGSWSNIYASGFADSGMYIGACQECDARVTGAVMEDNALGYSGSNAGGKLALEDSIFRRNFAGVVPNSENPGDPPPPQDGECGRPNAEHPDPTPIIESTSISRCTVIRHDLILENNNLTVPVNNSTAIAPWGTGVELPGTYADLVEGDLIAGNPTDGVLGFEYPNPFFPLGPQTIDFQIAGNRISGNLFFANGSRGGPFTGDVALLAGGGEALGLGESHSVNNCVSYNLLTDPTFPAEIEQGWSCRNSSTPVPRGGLESVAYLLGLIEEANAIRASTPPVGQPAPPPQPTMPDPCAGVPPNPLCR